MVDLSVLLQTAGVYGLVLSGLLMVIMLASMAYSADIWVGDYPPDIKQKYGAKSEKARRASPLVSLAFFTVALAVPTLAIRRISLEAGAPLGFFEAFLGIFTVLMVFNLVDLLIIDWLIFNLITPRLIVLPGTEGMAGYKNYFFHFRGFLIGTAACLVAALIGAGVALLF